MELISKEVKDFLGNSSMIRRMFEAGIELKKQYGVDKVYDFSLGNPDLPPPAEVKTAMAEIAADGEMRAFKHEDFWQCMDNPREYTLLNNLWNSGSAPWTKYWK